MSKSALRCDAVTAILVVVRIALEAEVLRKFRFPAGNGAIAPIVWRGKRHEAAKQDDHIFLPEYKNRNHAKRVIQRQFNALLERCGLKDDLNTNAVQTVYPGTIRVDQGVCHDPEERHGYKSE